MNQNVLILDCATRNVVIAEFHGILTAEDLDEAERQWKKHGSSKSTEHSHWDWSEKKWPLLEGALNVRCFGIKLADKWQGLAMVESAPPAYPAKLGEDKGKSLLHMIYLESAPWNDPMRAPQYKWTGTRLMEAAVVLSRHEGFRGRMNLFALPQAENFYKRCRMVLVDGVTNDEGLNLYEMTEDNAKKFLDEKR